MRQPASKLSPEEWARLREDWESRKIRTFEQLAVKWGVIRSSIKTRKRREMWKRHDETVKAAAESLPPQAAPPADTVTDSEPGRSLDGPNPGDERRKLINAVLKKHLTELNLPRAMLRHAIQITDEGAVGAVDLKLLYAAKATAGTLQAVQAAERLALGLKDYESSESAGGSTTINVYLKNAYSPEQMEQVGKVMTIEPKPENERQARKDEAHHRREPTPDPKLPPEKSSTLVLVGGASK